MDERQQPPPQPPPTATMDAGPKMLLGYEHDGVRELGVFDEELLVIAQRRMVLQGRRSVGGTKSLPSPEPLDRLKQELCGLTLSGGGIRSATFSLGVLKALSDLGFLPLFDYLSTVSGGGFVGAWWSGWLSREPRQALFPSPEKIEAERADSYVFPKTSPTLGLAWMQRLLPSFDRKVSEGSLSAGEDPIHHLRLFSNYLTPRKGILSADFWRAVAVVTRNLVMTWLVLIPLLLAVVLAGQIYFAAAPNAKEEFLHPRAPFAPRRVVAPTPGGAAASAEERADYAARYDKYAQAKVTYDNNIKRHRTYLWGRAAWAAALVGAIWLLSVVMGLAWFLTLERERGRWWLAFVTVAMFAIAACGVASYWQWDTIQQDVRAFLTSRAEVLRVGPWLGLWVAIAVALLVYTLRPVSGEGGLDVQRNRIVRWHARVLIALVYVTAWLAMSGFGHEVIDFLRDRGGGALSDYAARSGGWLMVILAALGTIFTAFRAAPAGGKDGRAPSGPNLSSRLVFAVTPPLVLGVLGSVCAWAAHGLLAHVAQQPTSLMPPLVIATGIGGIVCIVIGVWEWSEGHRYSVCLLAVFSVLVVAVHLGLAIPLIHDGYGAHPRLTLIQGASALFATALAWVLTLGWMVDPNPLSLHTLYKSRLVRAYLGASNTERRYRATEVTDAVEGDDVALKQVTTWKSGGPYHLINTTLNLVGGRDLATAQRSAALFTLSPLYCGSMRTGYRPTAQYAGGTLTLGTAVSISGAAASPNMGSVSPSAALAMLLTLLNVRLGYWAPTPHRKLWNSRQARLWPYYTLREFLSQTNDVSTYCYLTDGGHFDNTGLYPLVERGCRFIVLVDAGADPDPCFEDVGEAIRRCRIDFDAEICLDATAFGKLDGYRVETATEGKWEGAFVKLEAKRASKHFVVGTIEYSLQHAKNLGWKDVSDTGRRGIIVWLKPTLVGDEPADIRQYGLQNSVFPQQTTLNQWFGESQFESYRKLGEWTATRAFEWGRDLPLDDLRRAAFGLQVDGACGPARAPK